MTETATLGVDIGGTKVAAGVVTSDGDVMCRRQVPMVASEEAESGLAAVKSAINAVLACNPDVRRKLIGIGVCSPGPLDPRAGVVINPPNLPCWRNFPLAEKVSCTFGVPVRLDNDGNAAALAEAMWGSGADYANVFCVTLGTGIGTGIVFQKRIYHGRTGSAAEGGHLSIDYRGPRCACGKRGCVEVLCSGPAIAQRARSKLARGDGTPSKLIELADGNPASISSEQVGEAFRAGDAMATEVLRETADLLAVWLGNVVDLLEPDVVVVGGGVARLMSSFFGRIREQLPHWSINPRCAEIPLLEAKYGNDAGIVGAAALFRSGLNDPA